MVMHAILCESSVQAHNHDFVLCAFVQEHLKNWSYGNLAMVVVRVRLLLGEHAVVSKVVRARVPIKVYSVV